MSAETGKVCCNCRHCIRSRDEKYNMTVCRCEVHDMYLSYASVMGGCCKHWTKKQEGEETGGRVMSDLKPCPFCGRTDTLHFDRYQSDGEWWGYIECKECIMTGPVGKLKKDVVDAWNRRAKDDESGSD